MYIYSYSMNNFCHAKMYGSGIERKHKGKQVQQKASATECKHNEMKTFLQCKRNGTQLFLQRKRKGMQTFLQRKRNGMQTAFNANRTGTFLWPLLYFQIYYLISNSLFWEFITNMSLILPFVSNFVNMYWKFTQKMAWPGMNSGTAAHLKKSLTHLRYFH